VVGRPKAGHAAFNYSEALKAKGGDWTPADLAAFIHDPKEFVPGTKMIFPGVKDSTDLSDLLAYLDTLK
jgi:cytochrome c